MEQIESLFVQFNTDMENLQIQFNEGNIDDDTFHFHIEFYPPLRHGDKPKILAGSESMAGVFIMDVLPEETAEKLREHMR